MLRRIKLIFLWLVVLGGMIYFLPKIDLLRQENLLLREEKGAQRQAHFSYDYPYNFVARLVSQYSVCTATLISPKILLTAAHCVIKNNKVYFKPQELKVQFYVGSNVKKQHQIAVRTIHVLDDFKNYGFARLWQDWAFIEIQHSYKPQGAFPKIMEPTKYPMNVWQAGFGPHQHDVLYIDEQCKILRREKNIWRTNCLIVPGDSGGPLFGKDSQGHIYIVGVNSALRTQGEIVNAFAVPPIYFMRYANKYQE